MPLPPLAEPADVATIWHPLSDAETDQVVALINTASAKLRHAAPFDVDARMALWATDPTQQTALDPLVVADVVATIVKRFLVNPEGAASGSETVGPFSRSATYVNRYDKTGSDVRGAIQVTDSDIEQLRPAATAPVPSSFRVGIPHPALLVPAGLRRHHLGDAAVVGPDIVPDIAIGTGTE